MSNRNIEEEIVRVIGAEAAAQIFEHFGGMVLKVPVGRYPHGVTISRIKNLIGEDACSKFIEHFGGERLSVSKGMAHTRAVRNKKIIADYDAGVPFNELIRRYRLTTRHLRSILNTPCE